MQHPDLTPTRTGVGWRLPALAVVVVLVGLVAVTRLTGESVSPDPEPTVPALAAVPTPSPRSTFFIPVPAIEPTPEIGYFESEYLDGIPVAFRGEVVFRIADVLQTDVGETVLVGGWHKPKPDCERRPRRCPVETMADSQLDIAGDLSTDWVALNRAIGGVMGTRIVRATIEEDPRCSISRVATGCQPRLRVIGVLWVNGRETRVTPTRVRTF